MNAKGMYDKLTAAGIRIFAIKLFGGTINNDYMLFIHPDKTRNQFRDEIRIFKRDTFDTSGHYADDNMFNRLMEHLRTLGYVEVLDVVADVFEGCVTNECSRIRDDPIQEEQEDGFGHFGWENQIKGDKNGS